MTAAETKHELKVKEILSKSCRGMVLKPLHVGQRVVMQSNINAKSARPHWDIFGVVIVKRRTGSYTIGLTKGGQIVRNRVHLMPDEATKRG